MGLWDFIKRLLRGTWQVSITEEIRRTGYVKPEIKAFMEKIRPAALTVEGETGIPWAFAATQAGHESRWGLSKLTLDANNLFGITGDSWAALGKPVYWIETKEYDAHKAPYVIRRPFRKYADWDESLRDWAGLLTRRYPKSLAAAKLGDFAGFADGLQSGGYATDPRYAQKLKDLHTSLEGIA